MDSSQFLSFFSGLFDDSTNEKILLSAESIVNLVETKQKFENVSKEINKEKYRSYLGLCSNPTEDILYTMKRLIGGISSTGVNARRGFTLTFSLMVEKFFEIFNINELVGIIEKETNVSKSEKGNIKTCALSGKIIMLKEVLEISSLSGENILNIFKILFDLIPQARMLEEAILQILYNFLNKLSNNFYTELQDKKVNRFMDKFLNLMNKLIVNKLQFENIKNIYEFDLIFILNCFTDEKSSLSQSIKNFLHNNTNFLSEFALANYFRLLLSLSIRDNEFHVSFRHFLEFLKNRNEFPKVIEVWNTLIDQNIMNQLKQVSLKNYQFLIFTFSKFILQNFFILKYIREIFDSTFFDNLMKFNTNKSKIINSLIEVLMSQLKTVENETELKSNYCYNLLQIFGSDQSISLSPQSYKTLFSFLFNNLEEHLKLEYVETLSSFNSESDEEEESLMFRITALKQLMVSGEIDLNKSLKQKILQFFLKNYFNSTEYNEVEVEDIIEDRMLLTIFAYLRVNKEDEKKPAKDGKVIAMLLKIHKMLQSLIESKEIEEFEMEDYKIYLKFLKKFSQITKNLPVKNESDPNEKEQSEKLNSIIKLALLVLILFLKNPNEYADIIGDLYQITKFDQDWQKVYTDLFIELLHKGNNTLSDHLMNNFKKISKYMNIDSFQVLVGFLSQTSTSKGKKTFEDEEEIEEMEDTEEISKSDGKNKMFDDLVDVEPDVAMADI